MVPVELSSLKQTSTIKLRLDELGWLRLENLQWGWGCEACFKLDLIWYFVFLELLICCSCYYLFQLESRGLPVSTLNNALSLCLSSSPQSPAEQSFTAWWRHLRTQLQVCHLSLSPHQWRDQFPPGNCKIYFFHDRQVQRTLATVSW